MIFKFFPHRYNNNRYDVSIGCLDEKYLDDEVEKLIDKMASRGEDTMWHHLGPFVIRIKKSLKR